MVILDIDLLLADNTYLCWVVRCGVNILQVVDVLLRLSSQAFFLVESSHVLLAQDDMEKQDNLFISFCRLWIELTGWASEKL